MTNAANTPQADYPDLSYLGPATLEAVRTTVRICDRDIGILEAVAKSRKLLPRELKELQLARDTRHLVLTQPYPPPYMPGHRHGANDSGSQPGQAEPDT